VVLLHGAGLMPTMWQSQVEALGAERRAVAPWIDGLRPGRRHELSLPTASAELVNLLDRSGYASAAVVAHQLGAVVALQAAADHPGRVSRLLITGAMLLPGPMALRLQKAAIRMLPAGRLAQTGATKDDLVHALDLMAGADFSRHLERIDVPVLVVVGASDAAGLASAKAIAQRLPQGRLEVLPGVGATPSLEAPDAYNKLLVEFLAD
jgi:pimeloyl-ACP methyl ester carboxylesterase